MKLFLATLLLAYFLASTQAYPGVGRENNDSDESGDKNKDVETVLVLPGSGSSRPSWSFPGIGDSSEVNDDDEYDDAYNPFSLNPFYSNPFDGFMTRMQDVMRRLREQMTGILSSFPDEENEGPFVKIPEGANTTSTTKEIDGHIVVVNETVYVDNKRGTVFRFRVVDVKPKNETITMTESGFDAESTTPTIGVTSGEDTERENTTPGRSVETVEDQDNEIPKNQVELTA